MYTLSIIVPVYNKKDYIEKCIESILMWGRDGFEVILVDDGSTDGSETIIEKYSKDKRVTIVHQENSGVSVARNVGLQASASNYITFVDADDEVVPGTLDKILPVLNESADIVIAGAVREGKDVNTPVFQEMLFEGESSQAPLNFILTGGTKEHRIPAKATQFMSGCKEKFYRRSFINKHGIAFDPELYRSQDVLWSYYCYFYAERIHFLPVNVYINKEDPNGITKGMSIQKIIDNAASFIKKFDSFFKEKIDAQTLGNFYFYQSAVINYDAYLALELKRITMAQYRQLMKEWYNSEACCFMKRELKGSELSFFKRIAFYLMKMHMYSLVGFEMSVHHKQR